MIQLRDVTVLFRSPTQVETVLQDVDISLNRTTRLAILGLSGSGKSTLMKALSGSLPADAEFKGKRLVGPETVIHFFPQNPFDQFHPQKSIGWHIEETLRFSHNRLRSEFFSLDELKSMFLPEVIGLERLHPYQLSGGQLLRFNLMIAVLRQPDFLFADEPTASLDSETAIEVARLLLKTSNLIGSGLLVATHDLEIGRILADEAILIEDGRPIANGDYSSVSIKYLQSFAHHTDIKAEVKRPSMPGRELVTYENVKVGYSEKRAVIESAKVQLHESSRILITGKSGSGKSTLLRSFFDHAIQISGKTTFHEPFGAKKRAQGKHLGVVFQDSWSTLSPRLTVREILLETSKLAEEKITLPAITDWLARAGLSVDVLRKLPHELSGGQRQRLSILRAIIYRPKLLVLDEPTAYLDPLNTRLILELLSAEVPMNTCVLVSSHKPSDFAGFCNEGFSIVSATLQKAF